MKRLLISGIAALAIGLTGCTSAIAGQPTTIAPQASDFAVDVTVVSTECYTPDWCVYWYDVSTRWLPPIPLPRKTTTVTYTITGGTQIQTGDAVLDGVGVGSVQTYTNPFRSSVIGPDGTNLIGAATRVVVE